MSVPVWLIVWLVILTILVALAVIVFLALCFDKAPDEYQLNK